MEGSSPRISKVYQLSLSDDPSATPTDDFERDGRPYFLLDMTRKDEIGVDTKLHTQTVTVPSDTEDMEQILKKLDATLETVTEDGYTTKTQTLTATRTYPNLSDADTSLIPKTILENGRTLTLADVQWASSNGDADGARYTATVSYTGAASSRRATGYTVTADYTGEVAKTGCDVVTYTALFGSIELPEASAKPDADGNEDNTNGGAQQDKAEPSQPLPWKRVLTIGDAVLLLAGGGVFVAKNQREVVNPMKLRGIFLAAVVCALCVGQAGALEYSIDAPDDYLFGRPTSEDTIYEQEAVNVDRSKDAALVAPGFGTPTSYLPGSGEALTSNLVPGALSGGGLVGSVGSINYPSAGAPDTGGGNVWGGGQATHYTEVTSDLYYSGGHLGTLKIPTLGLTVKVYQGTDSAQLAKGAGHFTSTCIWDGNVCVAGHNRGVNNHFGKIHTLEVGDTITLTTKLGTRTYAVTSVEKVSETDTSGLTASSENRITLYTCVMNQRAYRWRVQATEV